MYLWCKFINKQLDGRCIDVMASNEVDGYQEPNQSKVPLMISNRSLLDKSAEKLEGNVGDKAKLEPSDDAHSVCAVRGRLVVESIACKTTG